LGLFGIEPGEYTVFSKAENWAEISIIAKAGDIIFIEQNVKMGFVMARNSLTKIANSRGKYYIKKNIGSEGKIFKTNL
jgi:hypothetical protein